MNHYNIRTYLKNRIETRNENWKFNSTNAFIIILAYITALGKEESNNGSHLRLYTQTSPSDILNISECFDIGDVFGAVHFEDNGMMYAGNGNMPGVYRIVGDTLAFYLNRNGCGSRKKPANNGRKIVKTATEMKLKI